MRQLNTKPFTEKRNSDAGVIKALEENAIKSGAATNLATARERTSNLASGLIGIQGSRRKTRTLLQKPQGKQETQTSKGYAGNVVRKCFGRF